MEQLHGGVHRSHVAARGAAAPACSLHAEREGVPSFALTVHVGASFLPLPCNRTQMAG